MSGRESSHTLEAARGDADTLPRAHQPTLRMTHFGSGSGVHDQREIARSLQIRVAEFHHEGELLSGDIAEAGHHALPHPGWTERHPDRKLRLSRIGERGVPGGQ